MRKEYFLFIRFSKPEKFESYHKNTKKCIATSTIVNT